VIINDYVNTTEY